MTGNAKHLVEWHLEVVAQGLDGKGTIRGSAVVLFTVCAKSLVKRGGVESSERIGVVKYFPESVRARKTKLLREVWHKVDEKSSHLISLHMLHRTFPSCLLKSFDQTLDMVDPQHRVRSSSHLFLIMISDSLCTGASASLIPETNVSMYNGLDPSRNFIRNPHPRYAKMMD